MCDDYNDYEGSRYDLDNRDTLVYGKIDMGEIFIYYSYWED